MDIAKERPKSWMRVVITLFILLHVYIMAIWGLPTSPFRSRMVQKIEDYVIWMGLWHSWTMFSPNPLSLNFNVQAFITYANGKMDVWEFPRMEKMGVWEKFQKERYRKWRERVRQDAYRQVWDETARWIARQHYKDPKNPPTKVVLMRAWGPIPPPAAGDYQPIPKDFDLKFSYRFKFYDVKKADLL
jgi:hypothetical protein